MSSDDQGALPTDVTVAIVGGGPAGCATALGLQRAGIERVLVLEATTYQRERVGESVPPDFRRLLLKLDLLEPFLRSGHSPCQGSRAAWGQDTLGYNDFIVDPHGPGWHLDRSQFERWLAGVLVDRHISLCAGSRFREIGRTEHGFELRVERSGSMHSVHAEFVVDAGGIQALLATRLGARRRLDDQMVVAAAFVELDPNAQPFDGMTLLEAVPEGWWYAARLPGGRAIVAFSGDAETIRAGRLDQISGWRQAAAATRHIAPLLAGAVWRHERPIRLLAASSLLEPCVGEGWLAVGDAASSFDPISAQGLHKAFVQGLAASAAISMALHGDASALMQYGLQVNAGYAQYWQQRRYFYALEQRWPTSSFWQRRQAA